MSHNFDKRMGIKVTYMITQTILCVWVQRTTTMKQSIHIIPYELYCVTYASIMIHLPTQQSVGW